MQPAPDNIFQLNGSTLAGIGAVLGGLSGAITFLFRQLLASKQDQITERDERIAGLEKDLQYWRDMAINGLIAPAERAVSLAEQAERKARGRVS